MLNKVFLIGNLAADPEIMMTKSDKKVAKFTLCCDSGYGEKKETEFARCVAWDKTADFIGNYLKKGDKCWAEGKMKTSSYEKDGAKVYKTEVIVYDLKSLGNGGTMTRTEKGVADQVADVFSNTGTDCPF